MWSRHNYIEAGLHWPVGEPQGRSLGPLFVTLLRLQPLFLCSDFSHLQCLLQCSGRLPLYFTVQLVWGELQGFRDPRCSTRQPNKCTHTLRHMRAGDGREEMFGTACYFTASCLFPSVSVLLSIIYSVYSLWLRRFFSLQVWYGFSLMRLKLNELLLPSTCHAFQCLVNGNHV